MPYEFEGKTYYYFKDFEIYDNERTESIEIKGAHFFRKDGTMFNPFRNKDWSDEDYDRSCRKYEAKHQCMLANGIRIIMSDSEESEKYMNYVNSKYGKKFLESCRTVNSKHEECNPETQGPTRENRA